MSDKVTVTVTKQYDVTDVTDRADLATLAGALLIYRDITPSP